MESFWLIKNSMTERLSGKDGSMNKQELIEHISNTLGKCLKDTVYTLPIFSITESSKSNEVSLELKTEKGGIILDKVPQKPTVPQFVADWYEENKDDFETKLFRAVDLIPSVYEDGDLSEFEEWFIDGKTKPFQTLVNMHQFGYTVKKEKRYYVIFKGMEVGDFNYLNFIKFQHAWVLSSIKLDKKFRTEHTKKQLEEAGFGWVFDCPGIEIEEVEE